MFTYLLTGSFGEYFLFYGLTEFYIFIMLWLEGICSSSCPRFFPLSSPGVLAWDSRPLTVTSSSKLIFSTPISTDGRRGLFPLWDSCQSFSFYLLLPGHWMQTSVGFHSDSHSLLSMPGRPKLTYITILFFLAVILWRPANSNTRDSRNSLFLFSPWETTWHDDDNDVAGGLCNISSDFRIMIHSLKY